ncbi:hypothetical protein AMS68_006374 [Peltaster fructicola]|uniref:Uncharacterized protein n=1 Tax=Peltaster fructicola TaxID=286661 RepID=A0A6H0Y1J8_9PEZI|nr:hypothetical protein AMS68_006374 [Peltaster fructicola]
MSECANNGRKRGITSGTSESSPVKVARAAYETDSAPVSRIESLSPDESRSCVAQMGASRVTSPSPHDSRSAKAIPVPRKIAPCSARRLISLSPDENSECIAAQHQYRTRASKSDITPEDQMAVKPQGETCRLLALPPELRNQIWRLALVQDGPIKAHNQFKEVYVHRGRARMSALCASRPSYPDPQEEEQTPAIESKSGFGLLACNKQMYQETVGVAYGDNIFETDNTSSMLQFVEAIGNCALHLTQINMGTIENLGNDRFWMSPSTVIESRTSQLRGLLDILINVPHFKRIVFECNYAHSGTPGPALNRNRISYSEHLERSVLNRTRYLHNQRLYELIRLNHRGDNACLACISASGLNTRSKMTCCANTCLKLGVRMDDDKTEQDKPTEQKGVSPLKEDQHSSDQESDSEDAEDEDDDTNVYEY